MRAGAADGERITGDMGDNSLLIANRYKQHTFKRRRMSVSSDLPGGTIVANLLEIAYDKRKI
jgi:hypothetical protein